MSTDEHPKDQPRRRQPNIQFVPKNASQSAHLKPASSKPMPTTYFAPTDPEYSAAVATGLELVAELAAEVVVEVIAESIK